MNDVFSDFIFNLGQAESSVPHNLQECIYSVGRDLHGYFLTVVATVHKMQWGK